MYCPSEQGMEINVLILSLLVLSADNFAKRLDPDQALQNVGPDLDPNCLTLQRHS